MEEEHKKSILVVDDSRVIRKLVRKEMEHGPFQVIEASNGLEALCKIQEHHIDLLILDIEMPKMNGFETLKSLETLKLSMKPEDTEPYPNLNIPVIFLTGSHRIEDRMRGLELGATDFFLKDYIEGELFNAAVKILGPEKKILDGILALVVDNSESFCTIIKNILESEGIRTIVGPTGSLGIEILKKERENINIIIADDDGSLVDGVEFSHKVRSELGLKDTPLIVISNGRDQQRVSSYFQAGATDYLQRPFLKEEFLVRTAGHLEAAKLKSLLKKNLTKLKHLNHLKDRFLAICSHDLRTPINVILGYSELLLRNEDMNEKSKKILKNIHSCGQLMCDLLNGQLDLSKIELMGDDFVLIPTPIRELVSNSVEMMRTYASLKNIELQFEDKIDKDLLIPSNSMALKRMVNNLLSNAIKFTPRDGKIQIILERKNDGHVMLSFHDSGAGMTEQVINQLFNQSLKNSTPGTEGERGAGLGLLITKSLVDKHFGKIEVTSKINQGTCFLVTLPAN